MANKHKLKQHIYELLKRNRNGSYATQRDRKRMLNLFANQLHEHGYKLTHFAGLKQKHIRCLNSRWLTEGLKPGTIKNRNATLRWLCKTVNRHGIMPSNDDLNVPRRVYATNVSKAVELAQIDFSKITNRNVLVQIHLQRYFGLRREECIKLKPHQADKGDFLVLEGSWCKGNHARVVPILTEEARYWLEEAKKLVTNQGHSLIPQGKSYIQHRNLYDKQVRKAGIKHPHGLRHAYAQERYHELTGWDCPACGGPTTRELTEEQKILDTAARLEISLLLGHHRKQVTNNYLGY